MGLPKVFGPKLSLSYYDSQAGQEWNNLMLKPRVVSLHVLPDHHIIDAVTSELNRSTNELTLSMGSV